MNKPSKKRKNKVVVLAVVAFLALPLVCSAAGISSEARVFNTANFSLEKKFNISFPKISEAASLAMVDLGGDGINEILIGAPQGEKPEVKIYREDGSLANSFLAYDEKFFGGVNVGAGDFDGDGKDKIIVVPASGAAALVKIFDGFGQIENKEGFFAFDSNLKNGAKVAAGDVNGDGRDEIIVGSGAGQKAQIKIFKSGGESLAEINPEGINDWSGVNVASGDIDSDGISEILAAPGWGSLPEVQIFKSNGELVKKILVYDKGFRGGVNLAFGDAVGDGSKEIVVGAGFTGGPHVRIFDSNGNFKDQFFPFDKNLRGGVLVGVGKFSSGENKIVALPQKSESAGRKDLYKYIEVDISEQKLDFYENGFLLGEHPVSTGTLKLPTPLGDFKIISKSEVAYSNAYKLYMPHFMLFTKSGAGIHGLPYWKNGSKITYEGANHLGKRVSHGCIRLSLDVAGKIFEWADVNTPVIVHQ
jgi:lipoprotein-anchoring transpeptidase ErfK/SrfK